MPNLGTFRLILNIYFFEVSFIIYTASVLDLRDYKLTTIFYLKSSIYLSALLILFLSYLLRIIYILLALVFPNSVTYFSKLISSNSLLIFDLPIMLLILLFSASTLIEFLKLLYLLVSRLRLFLRIRYNKMFPFCKFDVDWKSIPYRQLYGFVCRRLENFIEGGDRELIFFYFIIILIAGNLLNYFVLNK